MGDTKGLIDPSTFHPTSAQLKRGADAASGLVRTAGQELAHAGERLGEHATTVATLWTGLEQYYQAPEGERVLGLVGPAAALAEEVHGSLAAVRAALEAYADGLWRIAEKLAALEREARAFRNSDGVKNGVKDKGNDLWTFANGLFALDHGDVGGAVSARKRLMSDTVPWYLDEAMIAKNAGYWTRLYECQREIETVAWACSTMICAAAAPQVLAQAVGHRVDSVDQIAEYNAAQGWGRPREKDLAPIEQTWTALNANLVAPVAAFAFGWDTSTWDGFHRTMMGDNTVAAQRETSSQAWKGLGDTTLSLAVFSFVSEGTPSQQMLDHRYGEGWTEQRHTQALEVLGSMIGYDPSVPEDGWHKYSDAPYEVRTTIGINVVSAVVGPKGAGSVVRVAEVAEGGARLANTAGHGALSAARTGADALPTSAALRAGNVGTTEAAGALRAAGRVSEELAPVPRSPHMPTVSESVVTDAAVHKAMDSWLHQPAPVEPSAAQRAAGAQVSPPRDPALVGAEPAARTHAAPDLGTTAGRAPSGAETLPGAGRSTAEPTVRPGGGTPGDPPSGPSRGGLPERPPGDVPNERIPGQGVPQEPVPGKQWDPGAPVADTVPASHAPRGYGAGDEARALREVVNEQGVPVDHRTGEPLLTRADGQPAWHMAWDPAERRWVAENPRLWDPTTPPAHTIPGSEAPVGYTAADVQQAFREAPVDAHGRPVDHRTGEPLREANAAGDRGWHMTWDPQEQRWVAERPGSGYPGEGMPERGAPGSYGYDDQGDLLRWANDRPPYAPGQVDGVWEAQPKVIDENGIPYVEAINKDGDLVRIYWNPGEPRQGVWDMGHKTGREYRDLRERYLSHQIDEATFLEEYQKTGHYEVQDPGYNRSHQGEAPR
ncbi:MAG: GH-E family nuclease [Micrococcales bacterium]|nr:GH-E family nuclease [Micrococcales bacterium]